MRESATGIDQRRKLQNAYDGKNPRHRTRLLSTASHTYDKYAPDIAPGVQIEKEQQQG